MSFWNKLKQIAILNRADEEKIYSQVLKEIESGFIKDGLWAKAIQKSKGDDRKTKPLYIKYRVQSIKDEVEIVSQTINNEEEETEISSEKNKENELVTNSDSINQHDKDGYTPLIKAVKEMDVELVNFLLQKGADPNIKELYFSQSTALTMAKLFLKRAKTDDSKENYRKIVDALESANGSN